MREEIYHRLCYRPGFDKRIAPTLIVDESILLESPGASMQVVMADGHPLNANGMLRIKNDNQNLFIYGFIFDDVPLTDWYTGLNADVLLLDIGMPVPNGIAIIKNLLQRFPEARIIVFSDEDDPEVIRCMQCLGAYAYQVKSYGTNTVIETIIRVHNGEKIFPEHRQGGIARALVDHFIAPAPAGLSAREQQVLKLITNGKTNPQIAAELNISALTIKTHRQNLLHKFSARNTAQLISKGRSKGFI